MKPVKGDLCIRNEVGGMAEFFDLLLFTDDGYIMTYGTSVKQNDIFLIIGDKLNGKNFLSAGSWGYGRRFFKIMLDGSLYHVVSDMFDYCELVSIAGAAQ